MMKAVSFPPHLSNKSYEVTGSELWWLTTTLASYAIHTVQRVLLKVHIRRMHQSVFVNSPLPPLAISLLCFSQKYFDPTSLMAYIPGAHPVSLMSHESHYLLTSVYCEHYYYVTVLCVISMYVHLRVI